MNCLIDVVVKSLQLDLIQGLDEVGGVNEDQLAVIDEKFSAAANPFEGLESAYLQDKYFKQHLSYLVRF